jgi:hypothetical protein
VLCLARQGGEHDQACKRCVKRAKSLPRGACRPISSTCAARTLWAGSQGLAGDENEAKERPIIHSRCARWKASSRWSGCRTDHQFAGLFEPCAVDARGVSWRDLLLCHAALPGDTRDGQVAPVQVRREKRYTTRPNRLPDRVFPQLTPRGFTRHASTNKLAVMEGTCWCASRSMG